jgi:hypothetical protein
MMPLPGWKRNLSTTPTTIIERIDGMMKVARKKLAPGNSRRSISARANESAIFKIIVVTRNTELFQSDVMNTGSMASRA